jgi:PAS domain S-box-containing protein
MIRALIVDDKEENLYLLRVLLQAEGWTVDVAHNGAEALARAHQTPPNLVISDLLMPVMDGYTLLRHWKSDKLLQTIPFVVYTATYTEPKDARLALDLGADAFMVKPLEPEPFMARIQDVLAKKVRGEQPSSAAPREHEASLLKEYSEVLVNKLEAKVFQLEQTNRALQEEMARRQQTEAELLQSRQDWEDIFQSIGHPTVILDLKQGIVAANKECVEVTGKSLHELLNSRCHEVFHPDGKPPQACPMAALLESGTTEKVELEMELLGGYYLVSCTPILDEAGKIRKVIHVATDISERKRAEEALRERERAWATLINNLPGFVYRCANDRHWTMLYISNGCREVTGYEPEDFIGNKTLAYNDIVHPAYRGHLWEQWQDRLSKRVLCEVEYPITAKGGQTRWVWERGQGVFSHDGQLQFLEGFITDVTDRRNAENQMRLNEARLQSLHDIAQYKATSAKDLLDFALNEAIRLTGSKVAYLYHYDEEKNLFVLDTWAEEMMKQGGTAHPHSLSELHKTGIWDEALRHRKPIVVNDFKAPNALKTGYPDVHVELHNAMIVPVLADDRIVAVVEVGNKVSDYDETDVRQLSLLMDSVWRLAVSRRLEAAQRQLATAVEHTAEGVLITDINGTIEYVNRACEQMTGYEKEELLGRNPRILKSGEHDAAFYAEMWQSIKAGRVWSGRLTNRRKDGRLYHGEATISPVKDSSGKIVNFVAVNRDITEHLELSKQLVQAQKMEAVGTLAGGVAHDFNNVLQVALGYSDLILAREDLPLPYRADLQKIHESARRGADLVQRLLTFSRKTDIKPQLINLNHRAKDLGKMLERTIPKMIDIQLSLSEELATINADPTQVDQILMNLAVNARDAMPEGGTLIIETHNVFLDEKYARIHLDAESGHYVLLEVTDTGTGMDEDTLEHIFEPFFTTKAMGEGTGLGLAMVHGIVRQHGGHIRCYSEPGHGTTFNVYFPALLSEEERKETTVTEMPRGGSETILLVDDEEMIRELGSRILSERGYKVITASNGKVALDVYEQRGDQIALVILDLIMTEMGGRQCLERLLRLDPAVKVVIASGYSADGPTKEAIDAGAKGFVNKPYDIRQVLGVVREVLDAR